MVEPADIVDFAQSFSGRSQGCGDHEDLLATLAFDGDDASAFIEGFAEKYSVDMSAFLWFFHYNADEPPNFRRLRPVDREGKTFEDIPLTPRLLADAANLGHWPLEYPVHKMQASRWPMRLMFVFLATLVLLIVLVASD